MRRRLPEGPGEPEDWRGYWSPGEQMEQGFRLARIASAALRKRTMFAGEIFAAARQSDRW